MTRLLALCLLGLPATALAVPLNLTNQGYLADSNGDGLDGTYDLTFSLYDDDQATNPALWTETLSVTIADGAYSVLLGNVNTIDEVLLEQYPMYLGLSVDGAAELTPRYEIVSVPYAIMSSTSINVDGGTVTATDIVGDSLTVGPTSIDSSGIRVNGNTVIDGTGGYVGAAPEPPDLGCTDAQILAWDDTNSGWTCVNQPTGGDFNSSPAAGITTQNISDWDDAFAGWDTNNALWTNAYSYFDSADAPAVASIGNTEVTLWNSALQESDFTEFAAASSITQAQIDSWNAAAVQINSRTEILDQNDSRLNWVGDWTDTNGLWADNRLVENSRYSDCSGNSTDCSANYFDLTLANNGHSAVTMAHLDWSSSGSVEVQLSMDGGNFVSHRIIDTNQGNTPGADQYQSVYHSLADDLPTGVDVVVRVIALTGRMHWEGIVLSQTPLPTTLSPRSDINLVWTVGNTSLTTETSRNVNDLTYEVQLDRSRAVTLDYNLSGSMAPNSHFNCGFFITRPDRSYYPREGRQIDSAAPYFSVNGSLTEVFPAGLTTVNVRCRSGIATTVDNNPSANDWQDRWLRVTYHD